MGVDKTPIERVIKNAVRQNFQVVDQLLKNMDDYCYKGAKDPEDREEIEQIWDNLMSFYKKNKKELQAAVKQLGIVYSTDEPRIELNANDVRGAVQEAEALKEVADAAVCIFLEGTSWRGPILDRLHKALVNAGYRLG